MARVRLTDMVADNDLVCPPPVPACDYPTRRLALRPLHAQLSRRRIACERGLDVSYETVRRWVLKFGPLFARELRRRRPRPTAAAVKLMRKLLKKQGFAPDVLVTDKLRSYGAAKAELSLSARHEQGLRKNNRAENSHQPTRRCRRRKNEPSASNRRDQPNDASGDSRRRPKCSFNLGDANKARRFRGPVARPPASTIAPRRGRSRRGGGRGTAKGK